MVLTVGLTYGELFAGYGGLGLGVQSVLGGEMEWCAEFDKAPSTILAHHWPDVPNLGDVTKIDWASLPPVDVITGGSPCQDLSHAGKRAGMKAGTRSGLWASMCDAIDIIRPGLVVWENVRGALSAEADSALEPCPGCLGDGGDGPVLRALGRVLGDLAELRYDAWWVGLRAADAGAPHGRFRIFVFAWPADASSVTGRVGDGDAVRAGRRTGRQRPDAGPGAAADPDSVGHQWSRGAWGRRVGSADHRQPAPDALGGRLNGRSPHEIGSEVERVAPARSGEGAHATDWGQYAPAVARWEAAVGRTAPAPTELSPKVSPRLSPRFVEWMMGLPAGHVTDVPGITRNDQLKALGNGVVPQQAALATRMWLAHMTQQEAA